MAIYAIDFDGTLAETRFPEIIGPKEKMVEFVKEIQAAGHKTILWTSRAGEDLDNAVEWCREQGIIFDAVNKPLPEQTARWGNDTRKIYADYYIDDKAMTVKEAERLVDRRMESVEIKKERDYMNGKEVFDFLNAVIDQTKHGSLKWECADSSTGIQYRNVHTYKATTGQGKILIEKVGYDISLYIAESEGEYHDILDTHRYWQKPEPVQGVIDDLQNHVVAIYTMVHKHRMKHAFKTLYEETRRERKE